MAISPVELNKGVEIMLWYRLLCPCSGHVTSPGHQEVSEEIELCAVAILSAHRSGTTTLSLDLGSITVKRTRMSRMHAP